MMGLVFPYVNFFASLAYLYWRRRDPLKALTADALALAAAEITVVYVSIWLVSGMLWARASWGIWWTWDARLTTYLLLWLLYVSYLLLRRFSSTGRVQTLAAVLSVFAAIDVPIVFMSIQWWRTQHPRPSSAMAAASTPSMMPAFLWNIAGWAMWGVFILLFRFALERRRQLAEQDAALIAHRSLPGDPPMTWHTFFDFSTMAIATLSSSTAAVCAIQIGYLGWITRGVAADEERAPQIHQLNAAQRE